MKLEGLTAKEVIALQDKYLMKSVEAWNEKVFVEGKGAVLTDIEGNEYLDCFSGVSVINIGHAHPKVVDAVCDQMTRLTHLSTLYRLVYSYHPQILLFLHQYFVAWLQSMKYDHFLYIAILLRHE